MLNPTRHTRTIRGGRARRKVHIRRVRLLRKSIPAPVTDPLESAKAARLRYVTDATPGIRRRRSGKGFSYVGVDGRLIRDVQEIRRIRAIVIPPAWTDVWICPVANGHLQAVGRDAKGRKQYRYHPRWRETRDETKYERMIAFGEALPQIRKRVEHDLSLTGLPCEKVLAAVVRLMEVTYIRVGNPEYARTNDSYGLTTLRDHHVEISGSRLNFQFKGKGQKQHRIEVTDRRLARIVKRCQDIPGYELFQYLDESSERKSIDSSDVNDYLRDITGQDFTARDFRTWAGTVLATSALKQCGPAVSNSAVKKNIVEAIKVVAGQLGNTPAVCRKCYVHPALLEAYGSGSLVETLDSLAKTNSSMAGLRPEETIIHAFLKEAQAAAAVSLEEKLSQSLKKLTIDN